uniref:Uncharacterized protein n=1 Tax=Arundo donax TaxID=35708 RepID=A0A0A8Y8I6_ARUDO
MNSKISPFPSPSLLPLATSGAARESAAATADAAHGLLVGEHGRAARGAPGPAAAER